MRSLATPSPTPKHPYDPNFLINLIGRTDKFSVLATIPRNRSKAHNPYDPMKRDNGSISIDDPGRFALALDEPLHWIDDRLSRWDNPTCHISAPTRQADADAEFSPRGSWRVCSAACWRVVRRFRSPRHRRIADGASTTRRANCRKSRCRRM